MVPACWSGRLVREKLDWGRCSSDAPVGLGTWGEKLSRLTGGAARPGALFCPGWMEKEDRPDASGAWLGGSHSPPRRVSQTQESLQPNAIF